MKVREHMSATQLENIINDRKHLNPKRAETLLRILREKLESFSLSTTFEEGCYIYHTDDAIFYPTIVSSGSYWGFAFLNKKFILDIDMGRQLQNYITISFRDNSNRPNEEDKKEIVNELFYIIENADIFLLENVTKDNMIIEFVGV